MPTTGMPLSTGNIARHLATHWYCSIVHPNLRMTSLQLYIRAGGQPEPEARSSEPREAQQVDDKSSDTNLPPRLFLKNNGIKNKKMIPPLILVLSPVENFGGERLQGSSQEHNCLLLVTFFH